MCLNEEQTIRCGGRELIVDVLQLVDAVVLVFFVSREGLAII